MVWPTNDQIIGRCLSLYGEFAEGENIIMSQFISEGDTVIDIGANIGTPASDVPTSGFFWDKTWQPVVARLWRTEALPTGGRLVLALPDPVLLLQAGFSELHRCEWYVHGSLTRHLLVLERD